MAMVFSIFGIGYVGAVTAACLTRLEHAVIGVDPQPAKVEALQRGLSPIVEPELPELLADAANRQLLSATSNVVDAIAKSDAAIICVGTPPDARGGLDLRQVRQVAGEIAAALTASPKPFTVIFRSTMLPGSMRSLIKNFFTELISAHAVNVYFFPEFLREGSAVQDFLHPSLTVVGTADSLLSSPMKTLVGESPQIVDYETAEMLKYACNAYHANKVAFANEIGRIAKSVDVDGREVMRLLCADTELNISSRYLRPGTPFGGSCLPKDVAALEALAFTNSVPSPLLSALRTSNQAHLSHLAGLVESKGLPHVVLLGVAFKEGTDDLRGSATLHLAADLLRREHQVALFDPLIEVRELVGANAAYAESVLPELGELMVQDVEVALSKPAVVVIFKKCVALDDLRCWLPQESYVIDVAGWPALKEAVTHYDGICW